MDEGWTAINNRIKAIGLTIETGDPDWLEHVLSLTEDKHAKLEELEDKLEEAVYLGCELAYCVKYGQSQLRAMTGVQAWDAFIAELTGGNDD